MARAFRIGVVAAFLAACGSDQRTRPHDATAAEHRAMAEREQRAAAAHDEASRRAAGPHYARRPCGRGCWTSDVNPTARHARDAERHRELAAEHRAASSALVAAEGEACAGIESRDRDVSPFYHREDVSSVTVLSRPLRLGRQALEKTIGARVVFRAAPGMTAEWLQRVVDCHVARAAALGHDMPEMDYCPLVLPGVTARVTPTRSGFAVDVTSDDAETAREIVRRVRALK